MSLCLLSISEADNTGNSHTRKATTTKHWSNKIQRHRTSQFQHVIIRPHAQAGWPIDRIRPGPVIEIC